MGYANLHSCICDLERSGQLRRITIEVDPHLELAAIARRAYARQAPALLFERVRGCRFPVLANLYGSLERTRYIFRDSLPRLQALIGAKSDPASLLRPPTRLLAALHGASHLLPRRRRSAAVLTHRCQLHDLPQLVSWPADGGPFITLPQVYSEHPAQPGWRHSNLGMYRIQLAGNAYAADQEVGLHYQIHRGIGVHHQAAASRGQDLPVNVFVGGPPALAVAAVMPLPEGLPELAFAGALAGQRLALAQPPGWPLPVPAEADFVLCGRVAPRQTKPEGPFGDHLGYYSLIHDFPVLQVERVYHRPGAIWPFTSVGRPPQEDTSFGAFIHELTGTLIPQVLPGVRAVHAVDAAGVHPLLLAIGSERYTPYSPCDRPQELLTQACAILGQGQLSLAKYLLIANEQDAAQLDIHNCAAFLQHMLQRCDWRRDLHFHTHATIDTLDYSGTGLNQGSKVVIAACGPPRRPLPEQLPERLDLPSGFSAPQIALPGVLVLQGPPCFAPGSQPTADLQRFCSHYATDHPINSFPLLILCDDSAFAATTLENLLWVSFTRSDPARDLYGIGAFQQDKHWGCNGALVLDARRKPQHAPPLEDDAGVIRRLESWAVHGGPLHGII
ncbi:UbiD family decarboxylase [Desulfuromonas thiophila]|uniref:4-hydroxy-3-polyprenylbenzoate decarboxylase n=1 Tax=Desulfuromonas thiophila TaxID=57664 RepID=A0A1G7CN08_9BACT|nr:UbiD family decarboxylase [Desulfuromonas thiophila]MDY0397872.1 UbiD family decarboxylase [Desulfuromonas thiophila]SDE40623.1 4-hydroxy-3-polyprenylbenzoate decarboxylase [Desulfuromonas thiophila]